MASDDENLDVVMPTKTSKSSGLQCVSHLLPKLVTLFLVTPVLLKNYTRGHCSVNDVVHYHSSTNDAYFLKEYETSTQDYKQDSMQPRINLFPEDFRTK